MVHVRGAESRDSKSPASVVVVLLIAGVLAALVLSLSDRAPHLVVRLAFRLEVADEVERASFGLDPFLFGHAALWGGLAVLVVLGLGSARTAHVAISLGGLVGASVLLEEAQRRLTASRGFEGQDIAANVVGVLLAWAVVESLSAWRHTASVPA